MSNPTPKSSIIYSGFQGVDMRPDQCDNSHFLDALNVECINGVVQRRGGRVKLLDNDTIRPTKIIKWDGTTATDVTRDLTDGSTATYVTSSTTTTTLFVGCPFQFPSVYFTIQAATGNIAGAAYSFQRLNDSAWTVTLTDTTAVGGYTMKQNGYYRISPSDLRIWDCGHTAKNQSHNTTLIAALDQDLFWLEIPLNSTYMTNLRIYEVSCGFQAVGDTARCESYGMTEFTMRTGERVVVAYSDFPGRFDDAANTYWFSYSGNMRSGQARLWYYDFGAGVVIPIRLPQHLRCMTQPGKRPSFVVFNGQLIGSTSGGYLWRFDGTSAYALEATSGMDAINGVQGANGYLPQTPRGSILETYHNKLMVTGDPNDPLIFYASLEDNNINQIPATATVGGPNIWPLRYVYRIPGKNGDWIVGASVVNDRYCVLTRSQLWVFDDQSLRLANGDIGCVAAGSVQRIDNKIFFLADGGVMTFDSANAECVSDKIKPFLDNVVNWGSIDNCTSAHYQKKNEYWLWLPINGEPQNQIAAIYNYRTQEWRFAAGWYPSDISATGHGAVWSSRRETYSVMHSVTAATQIYAAEGRKRLITCDKDGIIWMEDFGTDDNGFDFPAYAVLRPVIDDHEDFSAYREWYLRTDMDGRTMECVALADGESFYQELDRILEGVSTNGEHPRVVAISPNAVTRNAQDTFASIAAWPGVSQATLQRALRFSFGRKINNMKPVLHWLPTWSGLSQVSCRGAVHSLQIDLQLSGSGR